MAPDTFHPFPKLPIEMRLKIWGFALPGPRMVEVCPYDDSCPDKAITDSRDF
jgi:hypothetical protein